MDVIMLTNTPSRAFYLLKITKKEMFGTQFSSSSSSSSTYEKDPFKLQVTINLKHKNSTSAFVIFKRYLENNNC